MEAVGSPAIHQPPLADLPLGVQPESQSRCSSRSDNPQPRPPHLRAISAAHPGNWAAGPTSLGSEMNPRRPTSGLRAQDVPFRGTWGRCSFSAHSCWDRGRGGLRTALFFPFALFSKLSLNLQPCLLPFAVLRTQLGVRRGVAGADRRECLWLGQRPAPDWKLAGDPAGAGLCAVKEPVQRAKQSKRVFICKRILRR